MKYDGTVGSGACMITSQGGTLGFQLTLECEDGEIGHIIWLTENTKERALDTFAVLGVGETKLQNSTYVENQLANDITGKPVSFTTVEETYRDKTRVKVGFINKRGALAGGLSPAKAAAIFFGGKPNGTAPSKPASQTTRAGIQPKAPLTDFPAVGPTAGSDDSDIPF